MRTLLIMFASLLVVPVASAAEMPKELRGEWCKEAQCQEGREDNRFVKCDPSSKPIDLNSTSIYIDRDAITFQGLDFRLHAH